MITSSSDLIRILTTVGFLGNGTWNQRVKEARRSTGGLTAYLELHLENTIADDRLNTVTGEIRGGSNSVIGEIIRSMNTLDRRDALPIIAALFETGSTQNEWQFSLQSDKNARGRTIVIQLTSLHAISPSDAPDIDRYLKDKTHADGRSALEKRFPAPDFAAERIILGLEDPLNEVASLTLAGIAGNGTWNEEQHMTLIHPPTGSSEAAIIKFGRRDHLLLELTPERYRMLQLFLPLAEADLTAREWVAKQIESMPPSDSLVRLIAMQYLSRQLRDWRFRLFVDNQGTGKTIYAFEIYKE